jgi:3-oxoadipate enol-lactonase
MPLTSLRGISLYYETHGDGPWLVLVHGAGGNHLSWWQQVPAFRASRRCLIFDQRGFGASTGPASPPDLTPDLDALLDHLGVERAVLVGQSMGGWSVLGAALQRPERVAGLLLTGTLAGLTDDDMIAELAALHAGAKGFEPLKALAPDYPRLEPERTFLYEQVSALNPPPTATTLVSLLGIRYSDRAAELRCPVAIVAGAVDQLFPLSLVRKAHAKLPGAEIVVVPDAGHSVYFERPFALNRALSDLLARARP